MGNTQFPVSWAEVIKDARLTKGWSVAQAARQAGVDPRTIASIEAHRTGRCRDTTWRDVCKVLGLWQDWLRFRAGQRSDRPASDTLRARIDLAKLGEVDAFDVFLASAMESMGDRYSGERSLASRALNGIRQELGLKVFYAGEERAASDRFEDEAWALVFNEGVLDRSRRFVLLHPPPPPGLNKPLASSVLIELGMAIAKKIPCMILYSGDPGSLPFLVRQAHSAYDHFLVVRYRDADDIVRTLTRIHRDFFPAPSK